MKKALFVSLFAGFALFGCIADNTPPEPSGGKGIARIKLPQLPQGPGKSGPAADYSLQVTVSGPGMGTLSRSWNLSEFGGRTVAIENIPAGASRIFTGRIWHGLAKTHEGEYSIGVAGGASVFVPLVLRDVRTGRAEICVEVEGWPGSPDCAPIDTGYVDSTLLGCWRIEGSGGPKPLSGRLHVFDLDDRLYGNFHSDEGEPYNVEFASVNGATRLTFNSALFTVDQERASAKQAATQPRYYPSFHLRIDNISFGPADEPNSLFWGVFTDPTFTKPLGKATGRRQGCPEPIILCPMDL